MTVSCDYCRVVGFLAIACFGAIFCGCAGPEPQAANPSAKDVRPEPRTNVVLVVVDALRGDRLEAVRNGHPVMPRLREFAEKSWWFTQAYAQSTWTKPSMVSIFTGTYPAVHRVQHGLALAPLIEGQADAIEMLSAQYTTLASCFHQLGYQTIGIQTNPHLKADFGFGQGFDDYTYMEWQEAPVLADAALSKIKAARAPFFIYTHFFDPHASYEIREPWFSTYNAPAVSEQELRYINENYTRDFYLDEILHDLGTNKERKYADLSENAREYVRCRYDGECAFTDEHVGRLFDAILKDQPNTIIIFTADHGEELWEHGSVGHAKTVYDEVARVPLLIYVPGAKPARIDAPVESIDIGPTLAAALSLPPLAAWQGTSLFKEGVPCAAPDRPVFSEIRGSLEEFGLYLDMSRQENWKHIVNHTSKKVPELPPQELYDLSNDSGERRNSLSAGIPIPPGLEEARRQYETANSQHPYAKIPLEYAVSSEEHREELNQLGYFGGTSNKEGQE